LTKPTKFFNPTAITDAEKEMKQYMDGTLQPKE
jgi:hypothetical protein